MPEKAEKLDSKTKLFQNYFVICYPTFSFKSKYGDDMYKYKKKGRPPFLNVF
jgi:hypothetical protein